MSIRKSTENYGVAVGTVAGWKQNKLKCQHLVAENGNLDQKRTSRLSGNAQELDDRIYSWFVAARARNIPVSGPLL
jgi:hypothetical protein